MSSSESNDNSNASNTPSDTSNTTPPNAFSSTPEAPSQETENSNVVQPPKNSNSNVNSSSNLEAPPPPPSPQGQEITQAPPRPSNLNANSNSNSNLKNAPAPQQSEEIFKPLPSLAPIQTSNSSSTISNSQNIPSPSTSPNSNSNSKTLPPPTIVSPTLQTPQIGSIKPMNPPPSQIAPTNPSTPFPPNQPVSIIKSPELQVPSKQLPPAGLSPPQQAGASPPYLNSPYYYPVQKSTLSKRSLEIGPIFIFIGVVSVLLAVIYLVARKKRKPEDLVHHYGQHAKSDIVYQQSYHYTGTPPTDHYLGPPRASTSSQTFSGNLQSSNSGNYQAGYYPGTPNNHTATKSCFSYEEIMDITEGFSRENLLGEGGFGCVYKGWLSDGRCVAVKQLKVGSGQGEREFRAEVEIISRIHHRHLVSLVGYCLVEQHRMLVYEFVPNGTLEHHLHAKETPTMDWGKRMKIAIGSARGLAYLHEDCHPRIIHRDIKSANILLDYAFEAQVADFGLAKFTNDSYTHVSTRIMGTFGYLAPEYASSGKLTDKSDVFSFGVVLLELITGRKPVDADESLVEWARPLLVQALETGNIEELVDFRLEKNYNRDEMYRMIEAAAACVRHSAPKRPRMIQVLRALENSGGQVMDLTNGVKVGQSTTFDPNKYSSSEIHRFQKVAFSIEEESSEEGDTPNKHLTRSGTRFVNS